MDYYPFRIKQKAERTKVLQAIRLMIYRAIVRCSIFTYMYEYTKKGFYTRKTLRGIKAKTPILYCECDILELRKGLTI